MSVRIQGENEFSQKTGLRREARRAHENSEKKKSRHAKKKKNSKVSKGRKKGSYVEKRQNRTQKKFTVKNFESRQVEKKKKKLEQKKKKNETLYTMALKVPTLYCFETLDECTCDLCRPPRVVWSDPYVVMALFLDSFPAETSVGSAWRSMRYNFATDEGGHVTYIPEAYRKVVTTLSDCGEALMN